MRRHIDTETPADIDPREQELQRVLSVLLPIRKQRLNRSERLQRKQKQQLQQSQQTYHHGTQQLQQSQQRYQQTVDAFAKAHQGKSEPQIQLYDAINIEQRQRTDLLCQQQQVTLLQQDMQKQELLTDDAQREVQRNQRGVEKIEYLLNIHGVTKP